ncbi:MAG TPA: hypothetical protein VMK84_11215, partial [Streptosporangiaceae bacterium]|nr:hypothetical protein [Streptosporangiaceae bacterium]
APSFTPAADAGAPGSPAGLGAIGDATDPAADVPGPPDQQAAEGTPAGNNWEPAGNGWDLGNTLATQQTQDHQDGPPTQSLPVRNGNGNVAAPANGKTAGGPQDQTGDAEAQTQAPNGGPSKLPAFGGAVPSASAASAATQAAQGPKLPIGSQNIHGSDGPSAGDAANGTAGPGRGDGTDGQVTVPPAGQEPRLPIFDSLESDWFRRSGTTMTGPQRALGGSASPPAGQGSWTSPADEGWRAAQVVASPAAGETTQAGLPRRVPRANLVPGSVGSGGSGSADAAAEAPARSADTARSRMASLQRGVREGRAAAPQIEEP